MKIQIFHAGDGDCVLISADPAAAGEDPVHILVDGGRRTAFREHARDTIYQLPHLDVVCVSHIDEDHIAGILGIVQDEVDWRVHDFEVSEGNDPDPPRFERPPEIREIWHNALFELVGDHLAPQVQSTLIARASILASAASAELRDLASQLDDLATGERSAMELSRRISDRQLGIPRNRPRDRLMLRDTDAGPLQIGPLSIRVLGPSQTDIDRLRGTWDAWIRNEREALEKLQAEMLEEERRLGGLDSSVVARPLLSTALGEGAADVTEPNLASLMLFVEEGDTTVLLTGDGVSDEILAGLDDCDLLDDDGNVHVTVLKVQHHGALANVTEEFVEAVTADHYLFCGNGAHHNPEVEVVEAFAERALERFDELGGAPAVPVPHFWFSSNDRTPGLSQTRRDHMAAAIDAAAAAAGPDGTSITVKTLRRDGQIVDFPS